MLQSYFERVRPEPGPLAAASGTVLDLGSHLAVQALVLVGPVRNGHAKTHHRNDADGFDDVFAA